VLWIVDEGGSGLVGPLVSSVVVWIAGVYCGRRDSRVVDGADVVPCSYNTPAQDPHRWTTRSSVAGREVVHQVGDLFVHLALLAHEPGHLLLGVHHGGVVPVAEDVGDLRVAEIS
jgi:hypothetical protein